MSWFTIFNLIATILLITAVGMFLVSFMQSGSNAVNVVDMRGCVLPKYREDPIAYDKIRERMEALGWDDDKIDYAFNCFSGVASSSY